MRLVVFFIFVLMTLLMSSCFTSFLVYYREAPVVTYHNDSLSRISNCYKDSIGNIIINFNAKLYKQPKEEKYHVVVKFNKKTYDTVCYNRISNLCSTCWDTTYFSGFKGYKNVNIKRNKILKGYDTLDFYETISEQNLTGYCVNGEYGKELSFIGRKEIQFQYVPGNQDYFYNIRLNRRKKWDKRYLLPLTIPLDIVTSPIQGILYLIKKD